MTTPRRRNVGGWYKIDEGTWQSEDGRFEIQRQWHSLIGTHFAVYAGTPDLRRYAELNHFDTLAEAKSLAQDDQAIARLVEQAVRTYNYTRDLYEASLADAISKAQDHPGRRHMVTQAQAHLDALLTRKAKYLRAISSVAIPVPAEPIANTLLSTFRATTARCAATYGTITEQK